MRVGIDIFQTAYEGTGSTRYVHKLLDGLLEKKIDVSAFACSLRRYDRLSKLGEQYAGKKLETHFFRLPPMFFEFLWNNWHVGNFEWFAGKVDIYHSSDWTQAPSNAKKVTTVHDLIPFLFPEYVHPRIRAAHESRWKWIVKEVDRVIVDAECTKTDILERFDIDAHRIVVIPLGVEQRFLDLGSSKLDFVIPAKAGIHDGVNNQDPHGLGPTANINNQGMTNNQLFPIGGQAILKKYNLANNKYILSVGTLEPRKNIKRLVGAYVGLNKELREEYPLVIVGKKAWAAELVIPEGVDVRFTGYVEEADLPYLYGGAKLFVMPSMYEGFGLPVLEAMACGTPVLAARLSSLPEVGGDTIQYFDGVENDLVMGKNMEQAIVGNNDGRVQKAFERAQGMTWEKTVEKTIGVYREVLR